MDFPERAKIRIEHWIKDNESHIAQYGQLVEQLEAAGMQAGGGHIREMIACTAKGSASLREALKAIAAEKSLCRQP
jgi:hypothetical protein